MYCSNCGKEIQDNWAACPFCGESLLHKETIEKMKSEPYIKEKVKFSHQWLIPKLIVITVLMSNITGSLIDDGITSFLYKGDFITLLVWSALEALLHTWFERNLINYAGNENIISFGIGKESFVKAEFIMKKIKRVFAIITAILYGIYFIKNIFNTGFFSLYTYLSPVVTLRNWFVMSVIIDAFSHITKVYRRVTKEDFKDDEYRE